MILNKCHGRMLICVLIQMTCGENEKKNVWNLINELSSRNTSKSANVLEIQVDNRTISPSGDMAGVFNEHFTNIGQVLAQDFLLQK